jgi:hypothetical protein
MNANEMADKLSQYGEGAVFASIKLTDVANMLREQQNQIAILEQQRDAYKEAHEALLAHNIEKSKMNHDQGA